MISPIGTTNNHYKIENKKEQDSKFKKLCSRILHLKQDKSLLDGKPPGSRDLFPDSKPFVRWWWLNGPFVENDIQNQLKWLRENGFGGVEIAWLFPFWNSSDYNSPNRVQWLSGEFKRLVILTKNYAEKLGLGCDFTFGSSWPFGGSFLSPEDQMHTFKGVSSNCIDGSWEKPKKPPILNHLSRNALEHYFTHMIPAFKDALKGRPSSLFCDSLEIDNDNVWSPELWKQFEARFGYRLEDQLGNLPSNPHIRYDTRKLLSETIVNNFYQPFTQLSHQVGAKTRVQCHGAPADLLSAYASVDIPESEALLFDPAFSRIAASAACLSSSPIASCETFTCLYGYPDKYQGKEQIGDLKLLFDAVIANGINQIVWHGMPYNSLKNSSNQFFATTQVGPTACFVKQLSKFNHYMETVCAVMRLGKNAHRMAVYLPNEDMMMRGELSKDMQTPAARLHWEMRHVRPQAETNGFLPVWLSGDMLKRVTIKEGHLCCGDMLVPLLYIDVEWLDKEALQELLRIVKSGGKIVLKKEPNQPGYRPSDQYDLLLQELIKHPNVLKDLNESPIVPLLQGSDLPPYWARECNGELYLFFAHPNAADVKFPLRYGQFKEAQNVNRQVIVNFKGKSIPLDLCFDPGDAIMVSITGEGKVKNLVE